jgi:flagellar protein FliO/FliZ
VPPEPRLPRGGWAGWWASLWAGRRRWSTIAWIVAGVATVAVFVYTELRGSQPASGQLAAVQGLGAQADPLLDGSLLVKVVLNLGIVLVLIVVSLFVIQRLQMRGGLGSGRKQMTLLESLRLSPRQALHLVRVGKQVFLVGATDQALNVLGEVDPSLEPVADSAAQPAASWPPLAETFQKVLGTMVPAGRPAPDSGEIK